MRIMYQFYSAANPAAHKNIHVVSESDGGEGSNDGRD
jgi:hypothetical protein